MRWWQGAGVSTALVVMAVALGVPQPVQSAVSDVGDYSIAAIESDLSATDKVGPLRAGMLCLPKGKLLWRDIAKPSDATAIALLSRRLSSLGLAVADVPDPLFSEVAPLTQYRIRVTYESLAIKLCIPGLGIGEKHPSGNGRIVLRWETFDRVTKTKIASQSFDVSLTLNGRDARNDSAVIRDALRQSADQYVLARRSSATVPTK